MSVPTTSAQSEPSASNRRRAIARRVADAHRGIDDASLLAFVTSSGTESAADSKADVDMGVVFLSLPQQGVLEQACARAGGTPWLWSQGSLSDAGMLVAFQVDGVEVQVSYSDHATLNREVDALLLQDTPDTPMHKLGESILKAEPLAGRSELARLQARLTTFPPELARAMVKHFLAAPTPWKAISQIAEREATLWCREVQVDACYRLCGVSAALSRRYFTRFQVKRMRPHSARFEHAPADLAERIERVMQAQPRDAFAQLYELEGDVLELVARTMPQIDLGAVRSRRAAYHPSPLTP
ncbi:MAG: hypothetical protein JHC40_16500 [Burkholderiales bacterium]|jgi:hypothetical protein|nr:hypothetical protein [Burkholderiales bacterium]